MTKTVSIIIPTYNSARTLEECLNSITVQEYTPKNIEVIIADAGSSDDTLRLAHNVDKFPCRVVPNKLHTGEAGKATALKYAKHEIVALIDSDNILPHPQWLTRMVAPFFDPEIVASEPIEYTYRSEDNYITRYCALLGMNDPLCFFLGNYDRFNQISQKWTEMPIQQEDKGDYLKIKLNERKIPTIGANGFCMRRKILLQAMQDKKGNIKDYLFDIDIIYQLLTSLSPEKVQIAKVKTGIVHLFCGNLSDFIRKQKRRIKDFSYYNTTNLRTYPWKALDKWRLFKFIGYSLTGIPLLFQAILGYIHHPDSAWFFHPIACWITLWIYGIGTIAGKLSPTAMSREGWKQ